ncbi:hypothetical protein D6789_03285 [Candidatus Woesearchaeota archaeon]|nr:MAG: hypothetical protein D6789_03285 [Candidatus Woesearchaeota archaeon]
MRTNVSFIRTMHSSTRGVGVIYNFCGETKGKTSSALGTILRALGAGKKVRAVFFMKHWNTSETQFLRKIKRLEEFDIDFFQSGDKDFIYVEGVNKASLDEAQEQLRFGKVHERDLTDIEKAKRGLKKAQSFLAEKPFLLVLDELNYALQFGLIPYEDVEQLLDEADEQGVHVIITGKHVPARLKKRCDLVTEMKKIKHPFDKGIYGVRGLDY